MAQLSKLIFAIGLLACILIMSYAIFNTITNYRNDMRKNKANLNARFMDSSLELNEIPIDNSSIGYVLLIKVAAALIVGTAIAMFVFCKHIKKQEAKQQQT